MSVTTVIPSHMRLLAMVVAAAVVVPSGAGGDPPLTGRAAQVCRPHDMTNASWQDTGYITI